MFLIKHRLVLDKIFSGKGFFFKLSVKFKIQFQIANSYNEYFMRKKKVLTGQTSTSQGVYLLLFKLFEFIVMNKLQIISGTTYRR